jgi:hypothetical protein
MLDHPICGLDRFALLAVVPPRFPALGAASKKIVEAVSRHGIVPGAHVPV